MALFDLGDDFTARLPLAESDRAREELRADLIVADLGQLGYDGLVPGERDTALGLARLRQSGARSPVRLLSANLKPIEGDNPFVGHLELAAGDLKICAIAINGKADYGPELRLEDGPAAASRELAALAGHRCDVKLLLAHMDRAEADQLLAAVPGFDAVVLGHQGLQYPPQRSGEVAVFGAGARGRQVGVIEFASAEAAPESAVAPPPFFDKGEGDRLRESQQQIEEQLKALEARLAKLPEPQRVAQSRSLEALRGRLADVKSKLPAALHRRDPRVFTFRWINLGTDVADAPGLKAQIDAFDRDHPEPPPAPPRPQLGPGARLGAQRALPDAGRRVGPELATPF